MVNKLFKSFFAVMMVLGSALGFVACEEQGDDVVANPTVEVSTTSINFAMEEGSQTVDVTANADWKTEVNADWVTVTPSAGNGNATITVAVAANDTGAVREATVSVIALHKTYGKWDTKKIKVIQSASDDVPVAEELLYGDNFDGKEATQTYGNGSSWPYVDQFPEFANPTGPASQGVTYEGKGVSVRANSTSDSNYSDYDGSGSNNIFFGSNAYFLIKNISLDAAQKSYKMTFGSEKYLKDGDSMFSTNEFHVYISKNGAGWAELDYTFAGTEGGRWNVATVEFTLTEVPESLYVKFVADVASAYRLDDVKLFSGNGGQSVTLPETGGGDGGGTTPAPAEGIYASDVAFVCASDDSENAAYGLGATTINGNAVTGFKLGKSKQAGRFTSAAVGVSGEKYLNFYAQGWKGGDVTLYYRVDGGATMSQKLASHDGVTGNPPYVSLAFAATDHYSVKLTGLTESSTIEFSTDANFALTSADSTMSSARAIVCGVKLSDEPIEGEDGGNTTPEPTPGGAMTIAEAIAAAANTAVIVENATVIGVYGRGALIEDATGRILAYAGSAVDVVVGDIVKVEGTMTTYGGLPQIGGTVTFEKTGSKSYTYPTAKVMDGAAFDAYLGNPVIEYVEYTGTLTINGNYYNVEIEGASTAIGSLAYVIDGTVDPALNGQKIDVRGWTIGTASGKYVNTMIRSVVAAGTSPEPDPTPEPDPDPTPDTPAAGSKLTVEEFLALANTEIEYELTGKITRVVNTLYGNFDLTDATGTIYIYGLLTPEGVEKTQWAAAGLREGDTITIKGKYSLYNDDPQISKAVYVSHVPAPFVSAEAITAKADDTTATIAVQSNTNWAVSCDATWVTSYTESGSNNGVINVTFEANTTTNNRTATFTITGDDFDAYTVTLTQYGAGATDTKGTYTSEAFLKDNNASGNNKYYFEKVNIAGTEYDCLKLGNSSIVGKYTTNAVGESGDLTLSFYALGWNGKTSKLNVYVDGKQVGETLTLTPNSGVANQTPYTVTPSDDTDYYTLTLTGVTESSTITFETVSGATRALIFGVQLY